MPFCSNYSFNTNGGIRAPIPRSGSTPLPIDIKFLKESETPPNQANNQKINLHVYSGLSPGYTNNSSGNNLTNSSAPSMSVANGTPPGY
jgi:hypothetical protein